MDTKTIFFLNEILEPILQLTHGLGQLTVQEETLILFPLCVFRAIQYNT
jgi:hypothetical protein